MAQNETLQHINEQLVLRVDNQVNKILGELEKAVKSGFISTQMRSSESPLINKETIRRLKVMGLTASIDHVPVGWQEYETYISAASNPFVENQPELTFWEKVKRFFSGNED